MTGLPFSQRGLRKYLVTAERRAFVVKARQREYLAATFCVTLAISGARISEVLSLTASSLDFGNDAIVFETLKRRKRGVYRAVPVPASLLSSLKRLNHKNGKLWPWGRTTAWKLVKEIMAEAGIPAALSQPKALRHGFAVQACQNGVPLNIVQRWLGHARIETTAIYTSVMGREEWNLARKTWAGLCD